MSVVNGSQVPPEEILGDQNVLEDIAAGSRTGMQLAAAVGRQPTYVAHHGHAVGITAGVYSYCRDSRTGTRALRQAGSRDAAATRPNDTAPQIAKLTKSNRSGSLKPMMIGSTR